MGCFFFQAEDGIRDRNVTGVQTCALPISVVAFRMCGVEVTLELNVDRDVFDLVLRTGSGHAQQAHTRSEERRVGKSVDLGGGGVFHNKTRNIRHPARSLVERALLTNYDTT